MPVCGQIWQTRFAVDSNFAGKIGRNMEQSSWQKNCTTDQLHQSKVNIKVSTAVWDTKFSIANFCCFKTQLWQDTNLAENDYSFDALQAYCFGINIKL